MRWAILALRGMQSVAVAAARWMRYPKRQTKPVGAPNSKTETIVCEEERQSECGCVCGRVNTSDQVPDIRHLQSRSRLPVAPLETAPRNAPSRPVRLCCCCGSPPVCNRGGAAGLVVVVVLVVVWWWWCWSWWRLSGAIEALQCDRRGNARRDVGLRCAQRGSHNDERVHQGRE